MNRKSSLSSLLLVAVGGAAALLAPRAFAFPAYTKKENKPCSFCHVNAAGGGKRNHAGLWYKSHNLSLAGFVPAGAAASPVKPPVTSAVRPPAKSAKKPAAKKTALKKPAPKKPKS